MLLSVSEQGSCLVETVYFLRKLNKRQSGRVYYFPSNLLTCLSRGSGSCFNIHTMSASIISNWNLNPGSDNNTAVAVVCGSGGVGYVWVDFGSHFSLIKYLYQDKRLNLPMISPKGPSVWDKEWD